MNIILINQAWLCPEFKVLGHNVLTAGWVKDTFDLTIAWGISAEEFLAKVKDYFEPDLIIYYDNSALPSIKNIEDIKVKKIFFSVDTFHHLFWHREFLKFFDLTLVAQKDYVEQLKDLEIKNQRIEWFPLWSTVNLEPAQEKTFDVSFRGTLSESLHPERLKFFERVSKEVQVDYAEGSYAEVYPKSRIVLNQAVKDDVNFRVFEVLMSGALLLTPRTGNGLSDLFTDGEHCVLYEAGSSEDAILKLKYYLENEDERKRIADKGRALALELYSAEATARRMLDKINSISTSGDNKNVSSSFTIQSFMVRSLWQLFRMDGNEKYLDPLEKSINHLQDLVSQFSDAEISGNRFETALVIADLVCSDILSSESYALWTNTLYRGMGRHPFVKLVNCAYEGSGQEKETALSTLREVRYSLVKQILNIT